MASSSGQRARTLKVKCSSWDQVEAFYLHKVKPGGRLPIRVPFVVDQETPVVIALELPSQLIVSIDGVVEESEPAADGKRSSIVLVLRGFEATLRARLAALVADARGAPVADEPPEFPDEDSLPPSQPADVPVDELIAPPPVLDQLDLEQFADPAERAVFSELERELIRLRECAAHEVLGVAWDAGVEQIRRSYFGLTKRFHPDVFSRYRSDDLRHLAQEIFIHINRGYDRMRDAAVAAGAGIVAGPALLPHHGWLADWTDLGEEARSSSPRPRAASQPPAAPAPTPEHLEREPAPQRGPSRRTAAGFFDELPEPLVAPPPAVAIEPPPNEPPPPVELPSVELPEPAAAPAAALPAVSFARPPTPAAAPAPTPPGPPDPTRTFPTDAENVASAQELLARGDHDLAREMLAKALRAAPRNRTLRALYHVAAGRRLIAHDDAVRAVAQLEAALAHDSECVEAKATLAELQGGHSKKGGLFKRLFK